MSSMDDFCDEDSLLPALLDLLRSKGVLAFKGFGLEVQFREALPDTLPAPAPETEELTELERHMAAVQRGERLPREVTLEDELTGEREPVDDEDREGF